MSEPEADVVAELRLLAEAVLDRLGPWLDSAAGAAPEGGDGAGSGVGDAATADCGWCPLCALAAALRGEAPELSRRLAEQGAQVLVALRAALDGHDHTGAEAEAEPAGAPPRVQRIPVRRSTPAP